MASFWSPIFGRRAPTSFQAGNGGGARGQGCRRQTFCLVHAAQCGSDRGGGRFRSFPILRAKAKIDRIVKEAAGFPHHTFVIAPGYYQNFVGFLAPQKQADGSVGWALPLDPKVRCHHMGDIRELGDLVAGAFAHPDEAGNGEYLPLVGDFMSFNEIIDTLNGQGHKFSFKQIPKEVFAGLFPGAAELAEMFSYWEAHTYLGSDSSGRIALANKIAGGQPTNFATWARVNVPVNEAV